MKSPGDRFDWLRERLDTLDAAGQLRHLTVRDPISQWEVDGASDGDGAAMMIASPSGPLVNFGSNDYLGLASAVTGPLAGDSPMNDALLLSDNFPLRWGAGASALVSGFGSALHRLQQRIAEFESTQASVVMPSGFAANLAVLGCLAGAGDVILSDSANHASIIDGCRLSKAERFIYPHADAKAVAALLKAHRHRFTRAFIVTDSVFSMDGDFAPLFALCELAEQYDAILIVDEAHATGVWGASGSGLCEHLGVKDRVPIRVGTLSKALGVIGGFVCGPQVVIDHLINHGRSYIFSTALPPIIAEAALVNLQSVIDQPKRRDRLHANIDRLRRGLDPFWQRSIAASHSQIVPLVVGENHVALSLQNFLAEEGFYVPAIRPPTVPEKSARGRISLSASHSIDQVDRLTQALNRYASASSKH